MPKRKRPEEKPKDQFKRFVEAAKKLGAEEGGAKFDEQFRRIARPPKRPKDRPAS